MLPEPELRWGARGEKEDITSVMGRFVERALISKGADKKG
jgi:hypothetical protein